MRQFGIFAKYWRPGRVKTRLAASVGPQLAAEFHRVCLELLLNRFGELADRRTLAIWPPDDLHQFRSCAGDDWELAVQADGDLGTKMAAYFDAAFSRGATSTVLIGSDSPTISDEVVEQAFQALKRVDVTLGPTHDGGYYLVGCRAKTAPIFTGVPWSTPGVWQETLAAMQTANCTWHELPRGFDVDKIADVQHLRDELNGDAFAQATWDPLRDICEACLRGLGSS